MAIEKVGLTTPCNKQHLNVLSTDTKPTNIAPGSSCYELDTKKSWVFSEANINPITGNGWWEL